MLEVLLTVNRQSLWCLLLSYDNDSPMHTTLKAPYPPTRHLFSANPLGIVLSLKGKTEPSHELHYGLLFQGLARHFTNLTLTAFS